MKKKDEQPGKEDELWGIHSNIRAVGANPVWEGSRALGICSLTIDPAHTTITSASMSQHVCLPASVPSLPKLLS